jgi:hypothetical protein
MIYFRLSEEPVSRRARSVCGPFCSVCLNKYLSTLDDFHSPGLLPVRKSWTVGEVICEPRVIAVWLSLACAYLGPGAAGCSAAESPWALPGCPLYYTFPALSPAVRLACAVNRPTLSHCGAVWDLRAACNSSSAIIRLRLSWPCSTLQLSRPGRCLGFPFTTIPGPFPCITAR